MIEVKVDSIRASLMSEHRVVILKDLDAERYLPIWIGPYEAEAIALRLQNREVARPLTHDLLNNVITELGGEVSHIMVTDVGHARIIIMKGEEVAAVDAGVYGCSYVGRGFIDIGFVSDNRNEIAVPAPGAGA